MGVRCVVCMCVCGRVDLVVCLHGCVGLYVVAVRRCDWDVVVVVA